MAFKQEVRKNKRALEEAEARTKVRDRVSRLWTAHYL